MEMSAEHTPRECETCNEPTVHESDREELADALVISPSDYEALSLLIAEAEKEATRMRKAIAEIARIVVVCAKCWEVRPCRCGTQP